MPFLTITESVAWIFPPLSISFIYMDLLIRDFFFTKHLTFISSTMHTLQKLLQVNAVLNWMNSAVHSDHLWYICDKRSLTKCPLQQHSYQQQWQKDSISSAFKNVHWKFSSQLTLICVGVPCGNSVMSCGENTKHINCCYNHGLSWHWVSTGNLPVLIWPVRLTCVFVSQWCIGTGW